jgi:hypothetical protein
VRISEFFARWLPRVAMVVFAMGTVVAVAMLAAHGSMWLAIWFGFLACAMTAAIRWVVGSDTKGPGPSPDELFTLPKPRRHLDGRGVGGREY